MHSIDDKKLSNLYSMAKIVINASLLEGFGSVPQEGLAAGCQVISSNTGWILDDNSKNLNLHIIKKHRVEDYICKINELL
jgi:glycosyltransferase involved in cell wall biosynthesis